MPKCSTRFISDRPHDAEAVVEVIENDNERSFLCEDCLYDYADTLHEQVMFGEVEMVSIEKV
jgi:hypothetical protein